MYRDDDDTEPLSNRGALERAGHRREERQELRKNVEQKKERAQLARKVLRQSLPGQPTQKDDPRGSPNATKTNEQALRDQIATINMKPAPDALIKQNDIEDAVKDEAPYEQQKDAD